MIAPATTVGLSDGNSAVPSKYNPAFLGSPPLLPGEDSRAYDQLLAIVAEAMEPKNPLEFIWLKDFADEEWEIVRLRRIAANLIKAAKATALADRLRQELSNSFAFDVVEAPELALKWAKGDPDAVKKVRTLLDAEPAEDELIAQAVSLKLDDLERLDRMIMTKEIRRDNALREMERHHDSLAARLRRAVEEVEDAEYSVIEEKPANGEHVAL